MPGKWSLLLKQKFSISLTPELQSWYDDALFESSVDTLFGEPVHPQDLVDTTSYSIWGGQMLPDTLQILGDGCGNTINLRFDSTGSLLELVYWNHDSGEWSPYGQSLSQVILFDALKTLQDDSSLAFEKMAHSTIFEWALRWSKIDADRLSSLLGILKAKTEYTPLFQTGLPEIALCSLIVQDALRTRLESMCYKVGGQSIAKKLRVDFSQISTWLRDPNLIPDKYRKKLTKLCRCTIEELLFQDWQSAVEFSKRCLNVRQDLSWPYHVLAEYCQRQGDMEQAINYLLKALPCFDTTVSFTASWEGWSLPDKYSAKKLLPLMHLLPEDTKSDPYFQAALSKEPFAIYEYWRCNAERLEQIHDFAGVYKSWYAAGWDVYCCDNMSTIIDGLVRTSQKASHHPLHKIALRHQSTM